MNVLENKTGLDINNVIGIALRDSNKKRPYLIMNKLQAKYTPVTPDKPKEMFKRLARDVDMPDDCRNIVVVGFAETATAIGATIAFELQERYPNKNVYFLPTTRQLIREASRIEFKEKHSHAVEQYLYTENKDIVNKAMTDTIVFAEDEITTGNTIIDCVETLRDNGIKPKNIFALSILNCMDKSEEARFSEYGIKCGYSIKTDKDGFDKYKTCYDDIDDNDNNIDEADIENCCIVISNKSGKRPRLGVKALDYKEYCNKVAQIVYREITKEHRKCSICSNIRKKLGQNRSVESNTIKHSEYENNKIEHVLCLGTEECIQPAIDTAEYLVKMGINAEVQTTTRVPVCVRVDDNDAVPCGTAHWNNPINSRHKVESFYGCRDTYIYNMVKNKYDVVVIITDGTYEIGSRFKCILSELGAKRNIIFRI